jgi:hypothetical protein
LRRKNKNDKIIFGFLGKVKKLKGFDIGGRSERPDCKNEVL